MGFLTASQLHAIGFRAIGEDVLISEKASFYGASRISLGNHVRIDDFCILSAGDGGIVVGNHVHIACYSSFIGKEEIILGDFSNISSRVSVYSSSDDYSGATMTNPTVSDNFKNVDHRPVEIGSHCIVGSGSIILPGVSLGKGSVVGALSLVKECCDPFSINVGIPTHKMGERSRDLLETEKRFIASKNHD
jgi:galactoside O-acetyltransferase